MMTALQGLAMIFRRCFIRALHICSCAAVMRLNCINSDCPHQPCTIPLRPSLPCWMRCRCQGCEYWPTAQVDTSHRDHALRLLQSCCIDVTLFTVFTLSTCLSATAEVTPPTRALWHPQGVPDWQKDHKKKSKKKQDHQKRSKKKTSVGSSMRFTICFTVGPNETYSLCGSCPAVHGKIHTQDSQS